MNEEQTIWAKRISDRLINAKIISGRTYTRISEETGIHVNSLLYYLSKGSIPPADRVPLICSELKISVSDLFRDDDRAIFVPCGHTPNWDSYTPTAMLTYLLDNAANRPGAHMLRNLLQRFVIVTTTNDPIVKDRFMSRQIFIYLAGPKFQSVKRDQLGVIKDILTQMLEDSGADLTAYKAKNIPQAVVNIVEQFLPLDV